MKRLRYAVIACQNATTNLKYLAQHYNYLINWAIIVVVLIFSFTSKADALNISEIFWAGESNATFGEERIYSVLGLAVRKPPLGYTIAPWIDDDEFYISYRGLTVNAWNSDYGSCDLYSNEYFEHCFDCFSFYDTKYVLIQLGVNDLLGLASAHGGDVDIAVNKTIAFIERIHALGKIVIWVTISPLDQDGLKDGMPYEMPGFIPEGAGDFGQGETHCTAEMEPGDCGKHWNSNHEYFINQLRPWCVDNNVGFIDVFQQIRNTYGDSNTDDFVEGFSKDGLHVNYPGSYIIYSYIRSQLEMIHLFDPDNDGNPNCNDNCPYVSNPLQENGDEDGLGNACDNCPDDYNTEQNDNDGDCIGNVCDECPEVYDPDQPDSDSDGTGDICDNCPNSANSNQENIDGDAKGDVCDDCPNDSGNDIDGDMICGDVDNCPNNYNLDQVDTDLDDIGDLCDGCIDTDSDYYGNPTFPANVCPLDNCPEHYNPYQDDFDGDGAGNVCDLDDDNDEIPDDVDDCPFDADNDVDRDMICGDVDNCPNTQNSDQLDSYPPQGNGIGDACDCECDFDCSGSVDATDVDSFLTDFGRSTFNDPCTNASPCNGDVDCNVNVDASDVNKFLEDFGRSQFNNPCPACTVGDWCVYP